ncbi:MAG: protein translocase subunit SecD, partial [Rhodospirillaceae bacterium]|nr:protein translocase subunit SecD [Rhodospirillaceae bacterium]
MLYFAPWKIVLVAVLCLAGVVFTIPNFLSEKIAGGLPDWLPHKQVNLGLDLQGGSHLLLEVEAGVVIQERLNALVDSVRPALRGKRIGYRDLGLRDNAVTVSIRKPEQLDLAVAEIKKLSVPVQGGVSGMPGARDIEVSVVNGNQISVVLTEEAIKERRRSAIEQSIEIVRRRIDELGTREPTIQRQGDDRILVQVPGLQDPERLKSILGKTAKMVFRLVDLTTSPAEIMAGGRTPPGSELLESDERNPDGSP